MKEFTREEMISRVKEHFDALHYSLDEYSEQVPCDRYDVRVPLLGSKGKGENLTEVFIEVVTTKNIATNDFFTDIPFTDVAKYRSKPRKHPIHHINDVSPLHFYRYYFPWAKVYYAIADYATELTSYKDFEEMCKKNNIGLIKVPSSKEEEVEIIFRPLTLVEEFYREINGAINTDEDDLKTKKRVKKKIESQLKQVLDYLVFYPDPRYRRRAIIARIKLRISLFLINKLQEIKNLKFCKELQKLSSNYRIETRSDYKIACDAVQGLWNEYLGLKYPNPEIQEKFEEIFFKEYTYREHFVHQFQVFLLGSIIIDMLYNSDSKNILEKFQEDYGFPFEIAWLAASTYHDYNYSTQKYQSWVLQYLIEVMQMDKEDVTKELSKLNLDFAAVRENFLQTSERILNILCNTRVASSEEFREILDLFLYEKIVTERNHALTSAVTLLKIYKKTSQEEKIISPEAIEQAALAISLHDEKMWEYFCGCKGYLLGLREKTCSNCRARAKRKKENIENECMDYEEEIKKRKILDQIDFKEFSLLYLLILCDSCHDEGRCNSDSRTIKSIIDNLEVNKNGKVMITLIAKNDDSYDYKSSEFKRIQQFLGDGKFKVILGLDNTTKSTSFVL